MVATGLILSAYEECESGVGSAGRSDFVGRLCSFYKRYASDEANALYVFANDEDEDAGPRRLRDRARRFTTDIDLLSDVYSIHGLVCLPAVLPRAYRRSHATANGLADVVAIAHSPLVAAVLKAVTAAERAPTRLPTAKNTTTVDDAAAGRKFVFAVERRVEELAVLEKDVSDLAVSQEHLFTSHLPTDLLFKLHPLATSSDNA